MVSTNTLLSFLYKHDAYYTAAAFWLWVGVWISFIRSCCILDVFMSANLSECMDCGGLELFRTQKATAYAV